MRLGRYECQLASDSLSGKAYGCSRIEERHRHRYEFNNEYREVFAREGLRVVGVYPEKDLVEVVELSSHPWFVATQFHPEFTSRPRRPSPLFRDFVKAAAKAAS